MKNTSKIPPGNMEKVSLGPSKAWLVRYPIDGGPPVNAAGEPRESISLVYALTCQDLQLSDLVIQKQFIDVLWAFGRLFFCEFI